jgi:hypothetical protein
MGFPKRQKLSNRCVENLVRMTNEIRGHMILCDKNLITSISLGNRKISFNIKK